jgi:Acyl-CoA reductase (LuxC)
MSASIETRDERFAAVSSIVEAAREVAADPSILDALVSSTGLSREGVALAMAECLETHPSKQEIDALVDRATPTTHVRVILSANVFTGALRAIACARAAAPEVSVQLSSRESVFAQKLIDAIADPSIFTADRDDLENLADGELHVYGRTETIEKVRAGAKPGVLVRAHGPGIGIAVVSKKDSIANAADSIARDVVPFDQRGCLSPRIVFVIGDFSRAEDLSERLGASLAVLGEKIPRGALTSDEAAESARFLETMRFVGTASVGRGYAVSLSKTCVVPPPGRHVHVASIEDLDTFSEIVKPIASYVTAVGTSDVTIGRFFSHSVRISDFGKMQKPPFDGPVDLREI